MGSFEKISADMAIAVVLSDYQIVPAEENYLLERKILSDAQIVALKNKDEGEFIKEIKILVNSSVQLANKEKLGKEKVSELLVELFEVSRVDGQISLLELKTIYDFAEHFDFTKEELALYLVKMM